MQSPSRTATWLLRNSSEGIILSAIEDAWPKILLQVVVCLVDCKTQLICGGFMGFFFWFFVFYSVVLSSMYFAKMIFFSIAQFHFTVCFF